MPAESWTNTTHDWSLTVDAEHLAEVRARSDRLAPNGVLHLALEVLAYASDEAESNGSGTVSVTLLPDGTVRVEDDGRGTDTRRRADGSVVRKPVMATADLRFYNDTAAAPLIDGHPRRGISVVAGLSDWLHHENKRREARWVQRYEHGVPVTDLIELLPDGTTGTTVHFQPSAQLAPLPAYTAEVLARAAEPWLRVVVDDRR